MSKIVKGTMLLTGATFLSKFLGMIYLIPFEAMVGDTGGTLYGFAYIPYTIFISISTLGVPLAVSKFVSKYNSLGDYETSRKILKSGMQLMAFSGLVAFLIMFFGAELLAKSFMNEESSKIALKDATRVIQMVSFALLIIPGMSIVRGFFQGHESMAPTAVSQVIEQVARIAFLLISVFVVREIFNGSIELAVGFATFAAFVGAIASVVVLYVYWKKRKPFLDRHLEQQEYSYNIPQKKMFKELLGYAGPFVLVGIAIPLYQFIDNLTFQDAMFVAGEGDLADTAYAAIVMYGHKLVIIPMTLATGLSLSMLPAVTASFTEQKIQLLHKQINQVFQIVILLIFPAVVGLIVLSGEAYGALYGIEGVEMKGMWLAWYAPASLLFGLFSVSAAVLQGINQQNFTIISLTAGMIIKASLNIPLILVFGAKGSIFATLLAVATAVLLNLWRVRKKADFPMQPLFKRALLVVIFTTIMALILWIVKFFLGIFINPEESRLDALIMLIAGVVIGGVSYLWLAYKSTLLERVLGGKVRVLDRFLNKKNS
ncbi:oligosaccharide flippase family protein [Halobacillus sp. MO56]